MLTSDQCKNNYEMERKDDNKEKWQGEYWTSDRRINKGESENGLNIQEGMMESGERGKPFCV